MSTTDDPRTEGGAEREVPHLLAALQRSIDAARDARSTPPAEPAERCCQRIAVENEHSADCQNYVRTSLILPADHPEYRPLPTEAAPSTHGAIKDGPHGTYVCTDCGQNINAPGCHGPLAQASSPPTFDALLNDPAQQLDTQGVVLSAVSALPTKAGDVDCPHSIFTFGCPACDRQALDLIHFSLGPDWLAQHTAAAEARALREAADELDQRARGGTAFNAAAKVVRDHADRMEVTE